MYALSSRSRGAAGLSLRSSKLAKAAAAVIEPLERRALLSAGDVLSTAITDVGGRTDMGGAVVRVADQKLLQVGLSYDQSFNPIFSLARFNADGTPDDTFGAGGSNIILNSFPVPAYSVGAVNAAAVDAASGRIIVVGQADGPAGGAFFVAAFTPDGQLDGGFGSGCASLGQFTAGHGNEARAVAIGNDGSVYVAGGDAVIDQLFGLAHFKSDGSLDDDFGAHGIAQMPMLQDGLGDNSLDVVHAMAIDSGGNIILAGSSLARFNGEDAPVIALQRYTATGNLDVTFGTAGSVRLDVPAPDVTALGDKAYAVVVDEKGKILVGGTTDGPIPSSDDFVLLRFKSDGQLDGDFNSAGEAGIVRTYFGGFSSGLITDIAVESDGAILAAGNVLVCSEESCGGPSFNTFAVARYDAAGALDSNFGSGAVPGVVFTQNFEGGRPEMNLATIALQSDASHNHFVALGSWMNPDMPSDGSMPTRTSEDLVLVRLALFGLDG